MKVETQTSHLDYLPIIPMKQTADLVFPHLSSLLPPSDHTLITHTGRPRKLGILNGVDRLNESLTSADRVKAVGGDSGYRV